MIDNQEAYYSLEPTQKAGRHCSTLMPFKKTVDCTKFCMLLRTKLIPKEVQNAKTQN